jgi:hypothetical protein
LSVRFSCKNIALKTFIQIYACDRSWDRVVSIATGYRLDDGSEFESRQGQEFSLLQVVQTSPGAHPASYPMIPGALSPGVERPGHKADHSPPASAEVKKMWLYTSTPPYAFMVWCLIKHRDDFYACDNTETI